MTIRASDGMDQRFAAMMRSAREERSMSQSELARRMAALGWPWHPQSVHKIENDQRKVSIGEAVALASLLKIDLGALPGPCETCNGKPPSGFICGTCGEGPA